ncbi:MAG: ATP-binding cassette domain-containing protein [Acidimicrobiia bacterium]|nr:ATP-binding cassette domain-containing protein [Acidimicrobiia bacterium]MDH5616145.1 ATP-binding cassette domain-containing protein [Acidimicrobiia bacterium]
MNGPIVRVENVVKTFGPTVRALDDVSLEFEPGIVYGLLGPNGAGKTTLIRVLTTLLKADSGYAEVAGIDVRKDPVAARNHIGLAGQFAAVDDYLTGRENVEMVGRLYNLSASDAKQRAADVLKRIHLDDAADRTVRTYSGGMRRRLDLAASLVGRPSVLFLDEPTTGIDPQSRLDLWDLIRDLIVTGTTVLLTTQYLDEADQLANQIAVIDRGKLIAQGTGNELKDKMGGSVIELHVAEEDRPRTLEALAAISGEATFEAGHQSIRLPAPDGSQTLLAVVRRLDATSITVQDVALKKPTLDDVFLALTGRGAAEAEAERESPKKPERRRRRERSAV